MRPVRVTHLILAGLAVCAACPPLLRAADVLAAADLIAGRRLPYVYGSGDLNRGGLDCSGFVRIVFRQACGIVLPDEADRQLAWCREHGQVWDATSNWTPQTLQPGDLIFYAGPDLLPRESLVSHVMIYCGNGIAVGAQGAGRQFDGTFAGVGYYPFHVRPPRGILGEPGLRFLGKRQVFAYARLTLPPGTTANPLLASIPAIYASRFSLKPAPAHPGFD